MRTIESFGETIQENYREFRETIHENYREYGEIICSFVYRSEGGL